MVSAIFTENDRQKLSPDGFGVIMSIDGLENEINFQNITQMIEEYKAKHNTSYIDACVDVCEKNGIEYESLKRTISKSLKEKIEAEASKLRLLKYKIKTIDDL